MRSVSAIWLATALPLGLVCADGPGDDVSSTYRSEQFGYELSYPAGMRFEADFGGSSGRLVAADTGTVQAYFEVWPVSECSVPREERIGAIAADLGSRRLTDLTLADGPSGSSYCGDPKTISAASSRYGASIYELELTCVEDAYADPESLIVDEQRNGASTGAEPIARVLGTKGPTFFADISQPWLKRVLIADPVGVDPRINKEKDTTASTALRRILGTLATFSVPRPPGTCIGDLR